MWYGRRRRASENPNSSSSQARDILPVNQQNRWYFGGFKFSATCCCCCCCGKNYTHTHFGDGVYIAAKIYGLSQWRRPSHSLLQRFSPKVSTAVMSWNCIESIWIRVGKCVPSAGRRRSCFDLFLSSLHKDDGCDCLDLHVSWNWVSMREHSVKL